MSRAARIAPLLLLALLVSGAACSVVPTAPSRADVQPVRTVLANGVHVLVEEHRASAVVALQLWVRAGGRDEAASELGLAHYLEHMLFKGTTSRPDGFIDREVEAVGGRMNAGTSQDFTYYHMVLPADRLTAGIETLADISVNATLDAKLLDAEKQVVLEEMRRSEDQARGFLVRQLYALLFADHPYGRPVLGTPDLIRGLTRETLTGFYRRHYGAEAFTLVVVGAVDPAEALDAARRSFGRIPRSGTAQVSVAPRPLTSVKRAAQTRPGTHAYLGIGWLAPKLDHADTPAVDLLVSILGHGRASRLTQALRERHALVSSIGSGYSALRDAGAVTVTAQLDPGNVDAAEREVLTQISRAAEDGVHDTELRRAITAAEARHAFSIETAEGRAYSLGRAQTVWRVADELAYLDRVRSVTREQVRAAARRYLDPERYARLAFLPPSPR